VRSSRAGNHQPGLRQAGAADAGGAGSDPAALAALATSVGILAASVETLAGHVDEIEGKVVFGLLMALAQVQGGNILVPGIDVAIGVPVTPVGIQRRLVFTIPAAATGEHTITLLAANAEIGSLIVMVVGDVVAPGSIYSVIDEASGGVIFGGPGPAGWQPSFDISPAPIVVARSFGFDGTNWGGVGAINTVLGGPRTSLGGIDAGL
jgi:hypothetical protein